MSKIVLISDNLLGSLGGCEANDKILQEELQCEFVTTSVFNQTLSRFGGVDLFVLSNFFDINTDGIEFLSDKNYLICHHDYAFCATRNPSYWENNVVPGQYLRNIDLIKAARINITQSTLQTEIFKRNVEASYYNLKGNLWSNKDFARIDKLSTVEKNGRALVLDNPNPIKNTAGTEKFCRENNICYDKVGSLPYYELLNVLAQYSIFVFKATAPETFSRTICEAVMLNVIPMGNELIGFFSDYSGVSSDEVRRIMKYKKEELVDLIKSYA